MIRFLLKLYFRVKDPLPFDVDALLEERTQMSKSLAQQTTNRGQRTDLLTRALTSFFEKKGYLVDLEVPSQTLYSEYTPYGSNWANNKSDRLGRIDMRIKSSDGILDIEIDTSNKMNSLYKLADSKTKGHRVLWVRHGGLHQHPSAQVCNMIRTHQIPVLLLPVLPRDKNTTWSFAPDFS